MSASIRRTNEFSDRFSFPPQKIILHCLSSGILLLLLFRSPYLCLMKLEGESMPFGTSNPPSSASRPRRVPSLYLSNGSTLPTTPFPSTNQSYFSYLSEPGERRPRPSMQTRRKKTNSLQVLSGSSKEGKRRMDGGSANWRLGLAHSLQDKTCTCLSRHTCLSF